MANKRSMFRYMAAACVACCGIWSCFFDADLPLENDRPVCVNHTAINVALLYPDSIVCTLTVDDRNDTLLALSALPCSLPAGGGSRCDSSAVLSWPGTCTFLSGGYGEKRLELRWGSNIMGEYRGVFQLTDAAGATAGIPFTVSKKFIDAFDGSLVPACWQPYKPDDSIHFGFDYVDGKLVFMFRQRDDTTHDQQSTGICSRFSFPDDFYTSIDFKLRDEMDEAFEVGFFVSTSSDTGRWLGERAGIFITGIGGRLRFECRSVDLQSYSFETNVSGGELGISRADSTITYFFHDGNPAVLPVPLTFQYYPPSTPVYVHLKMTVSNSMRDRNCHWNDFAVSEGVVDFPAD